MDRRNTKQRNLILEAVRSRCDHPTAEQITSDVKKLDEKISVGTVYRNLNILTEDGLISSVKLPDADRFDLRTDKHNHFLCENCGQLFDIDIEYNESIDNLNTKEGFYINSHQTVFKGLCPDCIKKINKEE